MLDCLSACDQTTVICGVPPAMANFEGGALIRLSVDGSAVIIRRVTQDPNSANLRPALAPLVGLAVPIAAPAIAIGAASSYFAGTVYRSHLLGLYGLSGAALDESIQGTMASGYLAILLFAIFTAAFMFLGVLAGYFFHSGNGEGEPSKWRRFTTKHQRLGNLIMGVYAAFTFAAVGYLAGDRSAQVDYRYNQQSISDGCKKCFIYKTSRGRVVGIPIGQDSRVAIIATRHGAALIPSSSIKAVRPVNPARPASYWITPSL